mmetsp:Transcript_31869/g.83507  ORF Transcript_31869/g.83507 Transcript_31869/m.83507 type:complete len:203 (+) Transcript_31869:1248-1856(+)
MMDARDNLISPSPSFARVFMSSTFSRCSVLRSLSAATGSFTFATSSSAAVTWLSSSAVKSGTAAFCFGECSVTSKPSASLYWIVWSAGSWTSLAFFSENSASILSCCSVMISSFSAAVTRPPSVSTAATFAARLTVSGICSIANAICSSASMDSGRYSIRDMSSRLDGTLTSRFKCNHCSRRDRRPSSLIPRALMPRSRQAV